MTVSLYIKDADALMVLNNVLYYKISGLKQYFIYYIRK